MGLPGSKLRDHQERVARDAEWAERQQAEPLFREAPERKSPLSLLVRLANAAATRADLTQVDKALVTSFNWHHWHRENCPDQGRLIEFVRAALIRRGLKVGGQKRVAKIARLIHNKAMSRVRPEDEADDPYWWR